MTDEQWKALFIMLGAFWVISKMTDLTLWLLPVFRHAWRDLWTYRDNMLDEGKYRRWMLSVMFLECLWEQFWAKWNGHELEMCRNRKPND